MQLCNLILRHGGSPMSSVSKVDVTPAEILVLKHIHGDDACVDIRPTKDVVRRQDFEWDRLAAAYDTGGSLQSTPGEEHRSVMLALFPGAMKKLPTTLEEIGLGHLLSPASIAAADAGHGAAAIAQPFSPEAGLDFTPGPEDDEDDGLNDAERAEIAAATAADAQRDDRVALESQP